MGFDKVKNLFTSSKYCEDCQKIRRKEFRRTFISYGFILILFVAFMYFMQESPAFYYQVRLTGNKALDWHYRSLFTNLGKDYQNDMYVQSIANICSLEDTHTKQVWCVHQIATKNFDYLDDPHNFYSPKKILTDGGVCRDWSVLFGSIYGYMGYQVKYVFLIDHVYVVITDGNHIWKIDQQLAEKIK